MSRSEEIAGAFLRKKNFDRINRINRIWGRNRV
jgi:hypothetical protein